MKTVLFLILMLVISTADAAAGLYVNFTNPVLSGMKPGMVYSLQEEAGLPLTVGNKLDRSVDVVVEIAKASPGDIREGYENIPDTEWLTVYPNEFSLEPGEEMPCEIIISIPNEEKYEGRHFTSRVHIRTRRVPDSPGVHVNLSYANIIRFSTGETPETIMSEYRERIMDSLRITLEPYSVSIRGVKPGTTVIADGFDNPSPQIINRSRNDYKLTFKSVEPGRISRYGIAGEYEPAPDNEWLQLDEENIVSESMSINHLDMEINIPDKEKYRDRKFAFVVVGELNDYDVPIEIFSRVYVWTE